MTYYQSTADHLHARGLMAMLALSKRLLLQLLLISIMVATGIALIFAKDNYRQETHDYQRLQATHAQLQVVQGQLLLEESTYAKQSRVQAIATQELNMRLPNAAQTKRID